MPYEVLDSEPAGRYEVLPSQEGSILDKPTAFASGFNRMVLSRAGLPFNPVDAVANAIDLGKAAIGAPYIALTGHEPPAALQLRPRSDIIGSGEWLVNQARRSQLGRAALDPKNPSDEGGFVQALGGGAGGSVGSGLSGKQEALNAGMGALSAGASKLVGDATGNQALAIAAGMAPQAVTMGARDLSQLAVRGGEKGRREMEQRIQDLKNAGVENPTLGLASGNSLISGTENLLQNTPGAIGVMRRARENAIAGLQNKTQESADLASSNRGTLEAGQAIQTGLNRTFKDDFKTRQQQLYDRMDQFIPGQTPVNVANTKQTIADLNADIPGAPNLSKQFKNARIQGIGSAIDADTLGTPPGQMITITGGGGIMNRPVIAAQNRTSIPGGSSTDTLPFEAVKKTRTLVGNEIADSSLMSDVPRSKWNPLYAALSQDMQGAAQTAGPGASKAFDRATDFTRAGIGRMDRVSPFADAKTPETSFRMYQRAAEDNLSTLRAVKKSLPEDARGDAAGTIIERLGKAKPGAQDESGGAWSPETFLTNWNRMTPQTRGELFSGFKNSADVKQAVDSVAKATSMMRDSSKLWSNPSGTAANVAARGTLGAVGLGGAAAAMGLVNPLVPVGAAGGILAANLAARGLTSRGILDFMSNPGTPQDWLSARNRSVPQQLVNLPGLLSTE